MSLRASFTFAAATTSKPLCLRTRVREARTESVSSTSKIFGVAIRKPPLLLNGTLSNCVLANSCGPLCRLAPLHIHASDAMHPSSSLRTFPTLPFYFPYCHLLSPAMLGEGRWVA